MTRGARSFVTVATLGFGLAATTAGGFCADCSAAPGGRVVLESDAVDPDVFLWDSRLRLADYAAGAWGNTRAIFAHTLLTGAGTQAVVIACVPAAAHPKFSSGDEDAIGVRVMSGPYRGRYGWVLSSDTHVPRPAGESAILSTPRN